MKEPRQIFSIHGLRKNRSGAALIEFSLLLPILFGLLAIATEFGNAFHQHHIASKGVKSAARYLARLNNDDICPSQGGPWTANVNQARVLAQTGTFKTPANVAADDYIISNWNAAGNQFEVSVDCVPNTDGDFRGGDTVPVISIRARFNYNGVGMLGAFGRNWFSIDVTHEELYIGG